MRIMGKISFLLSAMALGSGSFAQQNLTLYNMKTIPQRVNANPALMPDARFYLGIPVISNVHLGYSNSSFRPSDGLEEMGNGSYRFNFNRFADNLPDKSYLGMDISTDLLSFGFQARKNYFNVNITEKAQSRLEIPSDFLRFLPS